MTKKKTTKKATKKTSKKKATKKRVSRKKKVKDEVMDMGKFLEEKIKKTKRKKSDDGENDYDKLMAIKLDEKDWLMCRYLLEKVKGSKAMLINAKKDLEIFNRDVALQRTAKKNEVERKDKEMNYSENELKGFLAKLERKLSEELGSPIDMSQYTWDSTGTLNYSGNLDTIGKQENSSNPGERPKEENSKDDDEEANFHRSRLI